MRYLASVIFLAGASLSLVAAPRKYVSLNGSGWMADGVPVSVPHTWNAEDGADGRKGRVLESHWDSVGSPTYAHRKVRYGRSLPDPTPGRRQFIRFDGVSRVARVFVNGQEIGTHRSAFTAFAFELTKVMKPKGNSLEVVVDNFIDIDLTPHSADFTLFGGIYRDVTFFETDPVCIDPVTDGSEGVRIEADAKTGHVKAFVSVLGGPDEVQEFDFKEFELWSPENPRLYEVETIVRSGGSMDSVKTRFGFRTVEFRSDGFYLNGMKRKLRGMNRHQDRAGKGWALTAADEEEDIEWLKRIGADAVRTAHYPQSQRFYRLCDERGILAWVEEPNVNFITETEAYRSNMKRELRELVAQNRNHPSVFCWSLFNELNDWKEEFFRLTYERELCPLREYVRTLDSSRPIGGVTMKPHLKCVNDVPDMLGYNAYPGWYECDATETAKVLERFTEATGRACWGLTEYGAGGCVLHHDDPLAKVEPVSSWHPEEAQAYIHWKAYSAIQASDALWGSFVWALFDFAADRRQEGGYPGLNDKGLIAYDHKTPKDAFYLYEANWTKTPVLHLVGSRMTETTNATVSVLAFTNGGKVRLSLNGKEIGEQIPDAACGVWWPQISLRFGSNVIELVNDRGDRASATWERQKCGLAGLKK